jgi:PilZ domain-containing protein
MSLTERRFEHGTEESNLRPAERRSRRLKVETPILLHLWNGSQQSDVVARSYDLSEFGTAVSLAASMEVGERISLSLPLLNPATGHIIAVVRNQRGSRCGLEFVELDDNQRDELARNLQAMSGAAES